MSLGSTGDRPSPGTSHTRVTTGSLPGGVSDAATPSPVYLFEVVHMPEQRTSDRKKLGSAERAGDRLGDQSCRGADWAACFGRSPCHRSFTTSLPIAIAASEIVLPRQAGEEEGVDR